jgi:hypothetical protein
MRTGDGWDMKLVKKPRRARDAINVEAEFANACIKGMMQHMKAPVAMTFFRPKRSERYVTRNKATILPAGYTAFMAPSRAPSGLLK